MTLSEAEKWHLDYRVQLMRQQHMSEWLERTQLVYGGMDALRKRYINGEIDVDEFERGVERLLEAEA